MGISSLSSAADFTPAFLWLDDRLVPWKDATVHINAVGHASVSAVFEGIKAYASQRDGQLYVFRLQEHLRRLHDSARIVRLDVPWSVESLSGAVIDTLRANECHEDTYIRPWCFAKGIVREQIVPAHTPASTAIDIWPFRSGMLSERGVAVGISSWRRIDDMAMPPRVKAFSNYHNSRFAVIEAKRAGFDWPIFLNGHGKVTEGPGACVFMLREGRLVTPSISCGVLESITRATLLQLAAEVLHMEVVEREIDRSELYVADELFFAGTGWEVLPIVELDGLAIGGGRMGRVTRELDALYHAAVRGELMAYRRWCTPVW